MDLMIALSVVFVCFYVEALDSPERLSLVTNSSNVSSALEPISTDTWDFPFPEKANEDESGDKKEEEEEEENEIENVEIPNPNSNYHSMGKVASEKLLLDLLSKIQRKERESYYKKYESSTEGSRPKNQKWPNYKFLDYTENKAHEWNNLEMNQASADYNNRFDYETDYFIDSQTGQKSRNDVKTEKRDYYENRELSRQNTDYYDYYQRARNKLDGRYKSDGRVSKSLPKDNMISNWTPKTSCKKYLQFLRYAFKRLDETPYVAYDYEIYDEDSTESPQILTTSVIGPTPYVDTCGTSGHSNFQKFTFDGEFPTTIPYFTSNAFFSILPKHQAPTPSLRYKGRKKSKSETLTTFSYSSPWLKDMLKQTEQMYDAEPTTIKYSTTPAMENDDFYDDFYLNYPEAQIYKTPQNNKTSIPSKSDNLYNYRGRFPTLSDFDFNREHNTIRTVPYQDKSPKFQDYGHFELHGNLAQKTLKKTSHSKFLTSNTLSPWTNTDTGNFPSKSPGIIEDCRDRMLPCPDILNTTYPLNGYCDRYVSCEMGMAVRRTCPEGLQFNVVTKSCDLPHNSICNYIESGYYGVPGDCAGYFVCKNSVPEYRMCPPGLHFDVKKGRCVFVENSSCPMKCTVLHEAKQYDGVCNAYVICINGIPYYHKCPPNMNFDKSILTCVPENLFECKNNPGLLTTNSNINDLCRNVQVKYGSKSWCRYVNEGGENK